MPHPLWRSSHSFTTQDSRRGYGHAALLEGPVGTCPSLQPWKARVLLMNLCGRSRPVGPSPSSRDANVCRVCHCHCAGDRRSRHPLRVILVNGSFRCRAIAARTRPLIVHTIPAFTFFCRSYLSVFKEFHPFLENVYRSWGILESCGDPDPRMSLRRDIPPSGCPWYRLPCLGVIEPPKWLSLRRRVKWYPGPHGPEGEDPIFPVSHGYSPFCL